MGIAPKKRYPRLPGITNLPRDFKIININYRCVEVERPDGFTVFFDRRRDKYSVKLNQIRLNESPEVVMLIVGLVRGLQISENYAMKYRRKAKLAVNAKMESAMNVLYRMLAI